MAVDSVQASGKIVVIVNLSPTQIPVNFKKDDILRRELCWNRKVVGVAIEYTLVELSLISASIGQYWLNTGSILASREMYACIHQIRY
jgi:hypothetical protein